MERPGLEQAVQRGGEEEAGVLLWDEGSSLILPPACDIPSPRCWQRAWGGTAPATRIPPLHKEPAWDLPTGISSLGTHRCSPVVPGGPRGAGPAAAPGESVLACGESPGKELIKSSLRFLVGNNFLCRHRLQPRDGPLMQPGGLCVCCRFYPPVWCWKKPPKMSCWVGFCCGSRGGWEKGELLKPKLPDQCPPSSLGALGML